MKKICIENRFFLSVTFLALSIFPFLVSNANAGTGIWENVGTRDFADADDTSIAFNPVTNEPYIAYSWSEIGVMRFDGLQWTEIGDISYSGSEISLKFNESTNEPYVAFCDDNMSQYATVLRFDGASWQTVGSAGIASCSAGLDLVFNSSTGEPYLAAQGVSETNVLKYSGSTWENVGSSNFALGDGIQIAFDTSVFQPVVVFSDSNLERTVGMKFNGSTWEYLGGSGITESSSGAMLAINPVSYQPYVFYSDSSKSYKATVKKFNGSTWETVGSEGFSSGRVDFVKAVSFKPGSEVPYVAFRDGANGYKATVMKFSGSSWETVGSAGFSPTMAYYLSLAFHPTLKTPYISFVGDVYRLGEGLVVMKLSESAASSNTPSLAYNSTKSARKKIILSISNWSLSMKKKWVSSLRFGGRKVKVIRARKSGGSLIVVCDLRYKKWPIGDYALAMRYKSKSGRSWVRGTFSQDDILSIY